MTNSKPLRLKSVDESRFVVNIKGIHRPDIDNMDERSLRAFINQFDPEYSDVDGNDMLLEWSDKSIVRLDGLRQLFVDNQEMRVHVECVSQWMIDFSFVAVLFYRNGRIMWKHVPVQLPDADAIPDSDAIPFDET